MRSPSVVELARVNSGNQTARAVAADERVRIRDHDRALTAAEHDVAEVKINPAANAKPIQVQRRRPYVLHLDIFEVIGIVRVARGSVGAWYIILREPE
jgi:hypothetical protein